MTRRAPPCTLQRTPFAMHEMRCCTTHDVQSYACEVPFPRTTKLASLSRHFRSSISYPPIPRALPARYAAIRRNCAVLTITATSTEMRRYRTVPAAYKPTFRLLDTTRCNTAGFLVFNFKPHDLRKPPPHACSLNVWIASLANATAP